MVRSHRLQPRTSVYVCLLRQPTHVLLTPRACSDSSPAIARSLRTATVRLAKPTSNLFRARAKSNAKGLDTSGLTGVIAVDPDARTADVAGMCTYEDLVAATLPYGLSPLVVPQLKTITLGGAVTGLGIESTSFRNGLPHESVLEMDILTGSGRRRHRVAGTELRPVPRLPEFLWHSGLFGPAEDRAGARETVRRAEAPAIPLARGPGRGDGPHHRNRRPRRHTGRLPRRRGVQRRRELPVCRRADLDAGTRQRLHRPARSTTGRSSTPTARSTTGSPSTTTCGGGTPTGSGVHARSARRTRRSAGSGRGATGAAASTGS